MDEAYNTILMAGFGHRCLRDEPPRFRWLRETEAAITLGIQYEGVPAVPYTQTQFYASVDFLRVGNGTTVEFFAPTYFRHIATLPFDYRSISLTNLKAYQTRLVYAHMVDFVYLASRYFVQVEQGRVLYPKEIDTVSSHHRQKLYDYIGTLTSAFISSVSKSPRLQYGPDLGPTSPSIFMEVTDLDSVIKAFYVDPAIVDGVAIHAATGHSPIGFAKTLADSDAVASASSDAVVTDGTSRAVQDSETSDNQNDS